MEEVLMTIITDFRECDKNNKACEYCLANAKIENLRTSYCEFLREFGRQAMDDIMVVMESVL